MTLEPLRVLHITDTHIVAEPGAEIYGIDSFAALERLLAVTHADTWKPHLLIITGDLSEDGSPRSYQRLRTLLASRALPVYCVPGNHDVLTEMRAHLESGPIRVAQRVAAEPWQIILLNSQVPGAGHGYLARTELLALEEALEAAPACYTLVGLHHGPHPVCPMPCCRLENAEELLALLKRHPNALGIISGHTHCAIDQQDESVRILVTPSTCIHAEHPRGPEVPEPHRFRDVHTFDAQYRAFRRLELYPDGRIETELIWDSPGPVAARSRKAGEDGKWFELLRMFLSSSNH